MTVGRANVRMCCDSHNSSIAREEVHVIIQVPPPGRRYAHNSSAAREKVHCKYKSPRAEICNNPSLNQKDTCIILNPNPRRYTNPRRYMYYCLRHEAGLRICVTTESPNAQGCDTFGIRLKPFRNFLENLRSQDRHGFFEAKIDMPVTRFLRPRSTWYAYVERWGVWYGFRNATENTDGRGTQRAPCSTR